MVTGCIDAEASWLAWSERPPSTLSWDQIVHLESEGLEIGAHGVNHVELDLLAAPDLTEEVRGSRTTLSLLLGRPVRSFAYPFGYYDRSSKEAVRLAGYESACAVRNMLSSPTDDRFAMARVLIDGDCEVAELEQILDGHHLRVGPRRRPLRTFVRRAQRRARGWFS